MVADDLGVSVPRRRSLKKTFKSDVGKEFIKMAKDQLGIQIMMPVYFGSRSINLKPDKNIKTPADMAGIKLRMPPGEFWQFLGESLGANPTPVAYAEVYTALQTGTVDGQDNPLVASKLMKFDEVTTQFVLTSRHRLRRDGDPHEDLGRMKPAQQATSRPPPTRRSTTTSSSSTRRKRNRSNISRRTARRSTRRTWTRSAASPRRNTSTSTATMAEGRARAHQRDQVAKRPRR